MTSNTNKSDHWTTDYAATITDAEQAKIYVGEAVGRYTDLTGQSSELGRMAGVAAAYATAVSVQTGYLQGRLAKGESHAAVSVTADEYAAMFGVSKTLVSLWRNAGRAFLVHGIDPESEAGRFLINGGAIKKEVAAAIREPKLSRAALNRARSEAEKSEAERKATRNVQNGTPESATAIEVPRNNTTRLDMIEACLAATVGDDMTATERTRLEGILADWSAKVAEIVAGKAKSSKVA